MLMRDNEKIFEVLTNEEILRKAKPHNYIEKTILDNALKVLGENTTVQSLLNILISAKQMSIKLLMKEK